MTFETTQEEYRAAIERWLKNTTEEGDCRFWNGAISKNNPPVLALRLAKEEMSND
jgi:hypothetical protein